MADLTEEQIQRIAAAAVRQTLSQTTRLAREDAADLVKAAAVTAVNEAHIRLFSDLGYDLANKDDLKRLRGSLAFLERLKGRCDNIGQSISTAIANSIALFFLALLALGAFVWLRNGPAPPPIPPGITK